MNKERSDAGFRCWDRKQTLCLDDETELTGSVVDIGPKFRAKTGIQNKTSAE